MLDELGCTCQAPNCDRQIDDDDPVLVYRTGAGERHAYECACGAVTVTVHR